MILGAFGDSFTFGSDLKDVTHDTPSKLVWPALVANQLDLEFYNYATPGIGNLIIADDVLRCISTKKNNVFYVINWTWIDRFDYIGSEIHENNFGGVLVENIWRTVRPTTKSEIDNAYYKFFHCDFTAKLTNLMYINTASQALLKNNCKFLMTSMDKLLFDTTYHCAESTLYLQNETVPYISNYEGLNFLEWSKKQKFSISNNWHPLEVSHQKAAEYWLPTVKTLLNTHAKEDYLHAFK